MTVNPEYVKARTTVATQREQEEAVLFTAASVFSELPIELTTIIPQVYDREFSRNEYWFDADTIARLTRRRA